MRFLLVLHLVLSIMAQPAYLQSADGIALDPTALEPLDIDQLRFPAKGKMSGGSTVCNNVEINSLGR